VSVAPLCMDHGGPRPHARNRDGVVPASTDAAHEEAMKGGRRVNGLPAIDPEATAGRTRLLLDAVRARFGRVPNVARALAVSPAALGGWLGLSAGLDEGVLNPALREQIGLTVSQLNECGYGLAVHTTVGKALGLSADEIVAARRASATDAKTDVALRFARALVEERGHVADTEIGALESAGFGTGEIVEIIVLVAHEILTNYIAIVSRATVDFPPAEPLLHEATGTPSARG